MMGLGINRPTSFIGRSLIKIIALSLMMLVDEMYTRGIVAADQIQAFAPPLAESNIVSTKFQHQINSESLPYQGTARELLDSVGSANTLELTGVSKKVPLPVHAMLGQGYSRLSGNLRGNALLIDNRQSMVKVSSENAVSYDLKYVDSYEDLAKAMQLDARASFSGFSGSASASTSVFKSSRFSESKAYGIVRMRVITKAESLQVFNLSKTALAKIEKESDFISTYGDSFISELVYGAELFALLEFSAQDERAQSRLKVDVSGSFGSFSASASFQETMEQIIQNKNVRVLYAQTGGATGRKPSPEEGSAPAEKGGVLIMGKEEFLGRIRDFPLEARTHNANSAILWGEILDYNVTENRPPTRSVKSTLDAEMLLEDLGRLKLLVDADRDSIKDQLPEMVEGSQERARKVEIPYRDYISRELDNVGQSLMTYPSLLPKVQKARLIDKNLFEGFLSDARVNWGLIDEYWTCPVSTPIPELTVDCLYGGSPFKPIKARLKGVYAGEYPLWKFGSGGPHWEFTGAYICFDGGTHQKQVAGVWKTEKDEIVGFENNPPQCKRSPFDKPPVVVVDAKLTEKDGVRRVDRYHVSVVSVTKDWFKLRVFLETRPTGPETAIDIHWMAREPE